MSLVRNPNTLTQMREVLQQQSGIDQIQDQIVLTGETNPKLTKHSDYCFSGILSNATSATVLTTPAGADIYMNSVMFRFIKDATSTATALSLRGVIDGQTIIFVRIPTITLTADSGTGSISFQKPVKLDRGTVLSLTSDTNVANVSFAVTVQATRLEPQ